MKSKQAQLIICSLQKCPFQRKYLTYKQTLRFFYAQKVTCDTNNATLEEVGHPRNCIMVEAINQSGARIFLGFNLEEIVARGMKRISLRVFSALTSLVS